MSAVLGMGVKKCAYNSILQPTLFDAESAGSDLKPKVVDSSQREVFMKTLGFFCALMRNGCLFNPEIGEGLEDESDDGDEDDSPESPLIFYEALSDIRSRKPGDVRKCNGKLVFKVDEFRRYFIQCENHQKGHRAHLIICNLNEFDLEYLRALCTDELEKIMHIEESAGREGYGPLVACNFVSSTKEQKELCVNFHRNREGILKQGQLIDSGPCNSRLEVYYPNDKTANPWIAMVCRNPHTHPDPRPTRTSKIIEELFMTLLDSLGWRLADAMPCKIILDSAFMTALRKVLNWDRLLDPSLSDLHPSLGNFDHTARLINKLRLERFPNGTGFEGILAMVEESSILPPEQAYVRSAEKIDIPGEGSFSLIICMFKAMSELLLRTKRPSIDTSFKRIHRWQEFEIEAWFPEYSRSVVVARAFITSQSARAHKILFQRIFDIVEGDTGQQVQFRHIHGTGWDTIIADEHRGQALGLGLYLQDICKDMAGYCSVDWTKPLHTLTPYDHTKRCLRICFQHYTTCVRNLKTNVTSPVYRAMISLYSADPIPDYKGTIALIEAGGKKASDWLKDKLSAENSLLAAIYRPLSKIPVEVWKASPNTTNGNEQSHRNIYRDGRKMSLVPGAMRGFQYDSRSMVTLKLFEEHGIQPRDRLPTYYLRASRALVRTSAVQKRTVKAHDNELRKAYNQYSKLHNQQLTQTNTLKRAYTLGKDTEPAAKRLQTTERQMEGLRAGLSSLQNQSSGTVPIPPSLTPQNSHSVNSMHTISIMTADHSVNSTASDLEGLQYAGTHHLAPMARNSNLEDTLPHPPHHPHPQHQAYSIHQALPHRSHHSPPMPQKYSYPPPLSATSSSNGPVYPVIHHNSVSPTQRLYPSPLQHIPPPGPWSPSIPLPIDPNHIPPIHHQTSRHSTYPNQHMNKYEGQSGHVPSYHANTQTHPYPHPYPYVTRPDSNSLYRQ
ncbi:hypothetical protein M422DRAFT_250346 [Sphaerobolus stellatus SS14]|uniref:Uncharacterized protein n=1 Tax=Sphaerobolus stellatus (strain SS14) TaxID=990650 RepID=A0A0C9VUC8_SPHS4|nr:hypothetical protein M422DRAFT_250346 [Sphaerobolus stellatus SS14]